MPIEVRHGAGGGIAGLASLAAALSGGGGGRPTFSGGGGGGSMSIRGVSSLMPRGGIGPGHSTDEQLMREQAYQQIKAAEFALPEELHRKREEEKIKAEEWNAQYTAKQKQMIATIQNGIEQARASGKFSAAEMEQVERMGAMEMMGINPTLTPKDENQKQMEAWAAEGKGVGMEWVDEWGNVKTREADGTIKGQVSYDKTRPGYEAKLQREREKDLATDRLKLMGEMVDTDGSGVKRSKYSSIQIEAMLEKAYPWYREQNIQAEAQERQAAMQQIAIEGEMQGRQRLQQQSNELVLEEARRAGAPLEDQDMDLPPQVAIAQSQVRAWQKRYGGYDGLPDDLKLAWREAKAIMEQYASEMNQAVQMGQVMEQGNMGRTASAREWTPSSTPTPEFGF